MALSFHVEHAFSTLPLKLKLGVLFVCTVGSPLWLLLALLLAHASWPVWLACLRHWLSICRFLICRRTASTSASIVLSLARPLFDSACPNHPVYLNRLSPARLSARLVLLRSPLIKCSMSSIFEKCCNLSSPSAFVKMSAIFQSVRTYHSSTSSLTIDNGSVWEGLNRTVSFFKNLYRIVKPLNWFVKHFSNR